HRHGLVLAQRPPDDLSVRGLRRRRHAELVRAPYLGSVDAQLCASNPPHATKAPARQWRNWGPIGGGAGNRTRVLCRLTRASPCAVHCAATRPHRSREQAGVTGPAAVDVPSRVRGRPATVSLLADAGYRDGGAPGPTDFALAQAARAKSR